MTTAVIGALRVTLALDSAAFQKGIGEAQKYLNRVSREFQKTGKEMANFGKSLSLAITAPALGVGAAAVKMAGDFQESIINVGISSQASKAELAALEKQAIALGNSTLFSASQSADAMDMLAKNGLSAQQILGGAAKATVDLAAAAGSTLEPAAAAVTSTLAQFNKTNADLPKIVNQITGAVNQSKFSFDDYTAAAAQAGGVAGSLGVKFEDFGASIAAISPLFQSGSDAGTSFKTFLINLVPQTTQAAAAMKQYGLTFFDAAGKMRPMAEIAEMLRVKLGGLSDQAKNQVLKNIFGTDSLRTAIGLMNVGGKGLDDLAKKIAATDAAAQAATRIKGFNGQLDQLKGSIESLAIAIGKSGLLEFVTDLVKSVTSLVQSWSEASPATLRFAVAVGATAAAVGPLLFVVGKLTTGYGLLLPVLSSVFTIIGNTGGAGLIGVFKNLIPMVGAAATAIKGFSLSLIASPIGAIVLALTAAGAAYLYFSNSNKVAKASVDQTAVALEKLRQLHINNGSGVAVAGSNAVSAAALKEAQSVYAAARAQAALRAQRGVNQIREVLGTGAITETVPNGFNGTTTRKRSLSRAGIPGRDSFTLTLKKVTKETNAATKEINDLDAAWKSASTSSAKVAVNAGIAAPKIKGVAVAAEDAGRGAGKASNGLDKLAKSAQKTADDLKNDLKSLLGELLPDQAKFDQMAERFVVLKKALAAKLVSPEIFKDASEKLKAQINSDLISNLFPEQAKIKELQERYEDLDRRLAAKLISPETYLDVRDRLKIELDKIDATAREALAPGGDTPLDLDKTIKEISFEVRKVPGLFKRNLIDPSKDARAQVIDNFAQIVDGIASLINSIVGSFKRGGFSGILDGIVGIAQLGSRLGVFGGESQGLSRGGGGLPGFATGGSFVVGGRAGVDTNRIAFNATRGEIVNIRRPGDQVQGGRGAAVINNYYGPGADEFWAKINQGDEAAARKGAAGGASEAIARITYAQGRRLA